MKYNEVRPRKKGTPRKKSKKNIQFPSHLREVSIRYDYNAFNQRKNVVNTAVQSTWPSIVEYVGLSEYESKIYLTLVSLGAAGARRLSLSSDVPRTKVYGTLKKLIDYGLVIEVPGSPKNFIAADPRNAFSTLLELQHLQAKDFTKIMEQLGEEYDNAITMREPEIVNSWLLENGDQVLDKSLEFIRSTSKVLTIITDSDGLGVLFNHAGNELDELSEQEVSIKIYSPLDPKTSSVAREFSYVHEVYKKDIKAPLFVLNSDNSRYIVAKSLPRESKEFFEYGIFGVSPLLINIFDLLVSSSIGESLIAPILSV